MKFIKILAIIIATLMSASCVHDDISVNTLTYNDFEQKLKPQMNYANVVSTFGEPAKDIGSGIHIYVYPLSDHTEIWIGYTDKILYALKMNTNGDVISTLI